MKKSIVKFFSIAIIVHDFLKDTNYEDIKPELGRLTDTYYQVFGRRKLTKELINNLIDLVHIVKDLGGIFRVKTILKDIAEQEVLEARERNSVSEN